jgi:peroxin-5
LELEAAVQRDPTNASAWYELGVKQQENEREHKAIQALQRAVDLDPSHLPTWVALAVSYTNDSNRTGAYTSIREWVERNTKYQNAVQSFRTKFPDDPTASPTERFALLIQCLISMARSDLSGDIDADIQIALAVLMNTNEVNVSSSCRRFSQTDLYCLFIRTMRRRRIVSERHWLFDPM